MGGKLNDALAGIYGSTQKPMGMDQGASPNPSMDFSGMVPYAGGGSQAIPKAKRLSPGIYQGADGKVVKSKNQPR
jgi:hypothetical protein